jgi:hypothetical protein
MARKVFLYCNNDHNLVTLLLCRTVKLLRPVPSHEFPFCARCPLCCNWCQITINIKNDCIVIKSWLTCFFIPHATISLVHGLLVVHPVQVLSDGQCCSGYVSALHSVYNETSDPNGLANTCDLQSPIVQPPAPPRSAFRPPASIRLLETPPLPTFPPIPPMPPQPTATFNIPPLPPKPVRNG